MPFQAVPDTAEAFLSYGVNNIVVGFTLFYRLSGGYQLADLVALAGAVEANIPATLALMSVSAAHFGVDVRGLALENDQSVIDTSGAGVGTVQSPPLPNQSCKAIKRVSAFTGRSARGRIFTVGISLNQLGADENFVAAGYTDAWIAALEAIDTAALAQGWQAVTVSRFSNGLKRLTGVVFALVGWAVTNQRVDSRRDRMP